ncbi:hypothetical protein K1719_024544 [Acacia pycnantha]|nr:hypothetical protein K1719_024544 [Acacia pycnantha]
MNPGDSRASVMRKEDMDPGDTISKGSVVMVVERLGMCMEEGGVSPAFILVWNSRGATSKGFAAVLRDMKRRYRLDLVVILEPRISGNPASKVIKNWGFKHSVRMEAVGFSGGIWLLWEMEELVVDVKIMDEQFIHCQLNLGGEVMLFTAVYAHPNEQRRNRIWDILHSLACEIEEPWMMVGDFNEIRSPLEQKGGGRINEVRCNKFNQWIEDCNFIDVEASGPLFTWKGPKWEGLERVYKRLDRCLCNISWQESFEEAEIKVIPRVCSDHHPILVVSKRENQGFSKRIFRYEAMWQMHSNFGEFLRNSWRGREDINSNLGKLQQDLIIWNREVFGKIEGRKRSLLNRLNGIQRSVSSRSGKHQTQLKLHFTGLSMFEPKNHVLKNLAIFPHNLAPFCKLVLPVRLYGSDGGSIRSLLDHASQPLLGTRRRKGLTLSRESVFSRRPKSGRLFPTLHLPIISKDIALKLYFLMEGMEIDVDAIIYHELYAYLKTTSGNFWFLALIIELCYKADIKIQGNKE